MTDALHDGYSDPNREMVLESLTRPQCERIHEAALQVLQRTGVVFQCEEARALLKKGGARVDGEKVFVPESLVEWALETVPKSFVLHDQEGVPRLEVGGRNTYFGPGSDCLNLMDHRTGQRRDPRLCDLEELIKLCDSLSNIDFLMSMVIPRDVPREMADRVQMARMLSHSTKPIIAVSFSCDGTRDLIEMAEKVAGGEEGLRANPFVVHFIQPVKALVHNEDSVRKLMVTVEKGVPCLYLVSAAMGITSPITPAGYQAMGVAGQLAALVLAQLIREGAPFVVRGGRVVTVDMKTMLFTFAAPENRIFSADMAHYHNLPSFGTAGCSDSKEADWQAVAEVSLALMADALVGANLIHDVGYIESGLTYSAEMLALCDEIIGWVKAFKKRPPVTDETLALDLIDDLGFTAGFLDTDHTLSHYREQWEPELFDRDTHSAWEAKGSPRICDRVRGKIDGVLSDHQCRALAPDVRQELERICRGRG